MAKRHKEGLLSEEELAREGVQAMLDDMGAEHLFAKARESSGLKEIHALCEGDPDVMRETIMLFMAGTTQTLTQELAQGILEVQGVLKAQQSALEKMLALQQEMLEHLSREEVA